MLFAPLFWDWAVGVRPCADAPFRFSCGALYAARGARLLGAEGSASFGGVSDCTGE